MKIPNVFRMFAVVPVLVLLLAAAASGQTSGPGSAVPPETAKGGHRMEITSPAFPPNGEIPPQFTCEGQDLSPALTWSGVPTRAKSLAIVVDDPDAPDPNAPKMTWVHWVLYNLPVSATGLPESVKSKDLPKGALEGKNDWKRTGYGGPCPPIGRHRYYFNLYALDTVLPDLNEPTKAQLEKAMEGHVLAAAEMIGTYQKQK